MNVQVGSLNVESIVSLSYYEEGSKRALLKIGEWDLAKNWYFQKCAKINYLKLDVVSAASGGSSKDESDSMIFDADDDVTVTRESRALTDQQDTILHNLEVEMARLEGENRGVRGQVLALLSRVQHRDIQLTKQVTDKPFLLCLFLSSDL